MFFVLHFALWLAVSNNCFCSHMQPNTSDVIITYTGHAEAVGNDMAVLSVTAKAATAVEAENDKERYFEGEEKPISDAPEPSEPPRDIIEEKDEVVFIPNEGVGQSDDEGFVESERTVDDFFDGRRTLNDVMSRRRNYENTEAPQQPDVLFVTGKNNQLENIVDSNYRRSDDRTVHREAGRQNVNQLEEVKRVDCTRLDCNRTRAAVCGRKLDGHTRKYRLFLNECFLNKVNCGFKYDVNKYAKVPIERCNTVGAHAPAERRNKYIFNAQAPPLMPPSKDQATSGEANLETRRAFSARRSQNFELTGTSCAHACPLSCPSEYAPECAISSHGLKKVFLNHCVLDLDSCTNNAVWQQRPLAECIGNQQAELRQNRAFIGWMQRVGIIDAHGRFVHE